MLKYPYNYHYPLPLPAGRQALPTTTIYMFLTVHSSSGLIIGSLTGNPILAFLFGLISHFIIDAIPHGDTSLRHGRDEKQRISIMAKIGSADSIITISYLLIIFYFHKELLTLSIILAVIGALLPDFISGFYMLTKIKILKPIYWLNDHAHIIEIKKIHLPTKQLFWGGFIFQILFFTFLNYLLFQIINYT